MKNHILPLFLALIIVSCSSKETTTENETTYEFNAEQKAVVKWTAFKTSEKLPVGGTFDEVKLSGISSCDKFEDALEGISFSIPIRSTNTTNPERDTKIKDSFFGAMENTTEITGSIKEIKGNEEKGTCIVLLKLNNVEAEQALEYNYDGTSISMNGTLDLINFGAEKALNSLNEVCKELHTGKDGISKTWNLVDLEVNFELKKK